jgi:hypothetical protein
MNHPAADANAAHRHYGAKDDASRFRQIGSAEQAVPSAKANAMTKFTPTIFGLTVIAALLTGCTATPAETTPTTAPTATVAPTEAPVAEAPAAPVAPVTGDVVDAATAAELKDANEGQRAYPLDDGTFVVVNKTEPLPAVVQADAEAKSAASLAPLTDYNNDAKAARAGIGQAQGYVAKNTGKRVIVAWQIHALENTRSEVASDYWIVAGGPDQTVHYFSQAKAQSAIDGWLAEQEEAATYAVVFVG